MAKGFRMNGKSFSPILQDHRFFANRDADISSEISRLLPMRNPTTIRWFVISIIVDPIYLLSFRLFAHIFQKVSKCSPSVADTYSPPSIERVGDGIWIRKSLNRVRPTVVRCGSLESGVAV